MPLEYITPPDFYQTSNPHQTVIVTSQHPAAQLVYPERITVHLLNLDPNSIVYLGGNQSILAGDLNNTIPLFPGASYISAGNLPVFGICKPGQTAAVARSPDAVNYFVPGGVTVVTGGSTNVTEDVSSPPIPAGVQNVSGPSITTAAFSPPANCWLVAILNADMQNTPYTLTMSDSGGHTWTKVVFKDDLTAGNALKVTSIWRAQITTAPGSITVTGKQTNTSAPGGLQLVVKVLTNSNANQSTAANAATSGNSTNVTANIVTTKAGSLVYVAAVIANNLTETPISGTTDINDFADTSLVNDLVAGKSAANTTVAGSTTFGWTIGSTTNFLWCAMEVIP